MSLKQMTKELLKRIERLVYETDQGLVEADPELARVEDLVAGYGTDGAILLPNGGIYGTAEGVTTERGMWAHTALFKYPTAAAAIEAVSSNANDASGGTGATEVTVLYLDSNFDIQSLVITMNGTTPVPSTETDIFRVLMCFVSAYGSGKANAGAISIRDAATSTNVYEYIPIGANKSRSAKFTVPNGKILAVVGTTLCNDALIAGTMAAYANFNFSSGAKLATGYWARFANTKMNLGNNCEMWPEPVVFPKGVDVEVRAAAGATTNLSGGLHAYLMDA